ncbi:endoplasmic oxidoreductin-1 [Conoideocrella luteorostrata]|uniref:Endoplasmic oxidoreductin-1 n=1 Tax=Conoideocrella luteorostrata TaxID=1105319 RepID=A0AAJ0CPL7_9HYPO|nr:endoplasmic oxidoreductin-1 [Conoideocrella luteorostrata]
MRSASRLFYLSVFTLWASPANCTASSEDECAITPKSIVQDACASYATLEKLNERVKPALDDLTRTTDFFSHYRLNLFNKRCPFWNDENGFCGNIGCAVETLDNEEDIPEVWRAKELGKLEGPLAKHPGKQEQKKNPKRPLHGELGEDVGESCVVEYDDECDERDYCVLEDETASSKGDYVSLLRNPERFTGYGGEGAKQVWDAIYRENCFQKSSFPHSANLGMSLNYNPAAQGFKQVLDAAGRQAQLHAQRAQYPNTPFVANTGYEVDDECLEKRVFYRVMSGMHASISAHLCWDFLNQTTGLWQPNLQCYKDRLHGYSDRISNLYFNYALLTRAVAKLGPYLRSSEYTFCTGDPSEDMATRAKVDEVTKKAGSIPQIFDEGLMFVNGEGPSLKEDFRNRFRNVSRLMDCVGCDKCRLWGKIQTNGYGTALKVLFEFDNNSEDIPALKRTELVALFNTYARLSESMRAIGKFKEMVVAEKNENMPIKERQPSAPSSPELIKEKMDENEDDDGTTKTGGSKETDLWDELLEMQRRGPKSGSVSDQFAHELALFRQSVKVALHGWLQGSILICRIAANEVHRFWLYFLGLQPGPGIVNYSWTPKDK